MSADRSIRAAEDAGATAARTSTLRRALPALVLLLAVVFAAGVRWRLREIPLERDEGEFAYGGQLMLQGVPPYVDAYNQKFPGVTAAYALVMAAFGQTPAAIHLGTLLVNAMTIGLLFLLARRLWDAYAAALAAAAYALLSMDQGSLGLAGHATHFVVLFAVGGAILLLRGLERDRNPTLALSGVAFGTATLMKQPGAWFIAFGVVWISIHHALERPVRWRRLLAHGTAFTAGAALPLLVTAAMLWRAGVFARFWFWTIVFARAYASQVSFAEAPGVLADVFAGLSRQSRSLWVLVGVSVVLACGARGARRQALFTATLLVFSFLATSAGLLYREHYFILVMPAAALFVGAGMAAARNRLAVRSSTMAAMLPAALFAASCAVMIWNERDYFFVMTPEQACRSTYGGNPFVEAPVIARYLAARTAAGDRIAVLGSEAEILFYARRLSATGYIFTYGLMQTHPYALRMQHEMAAEIQKAKPGYLVFVNVPWSWLAGPRSDLWIFGWFARYATRYDVVGIAEMTDEATTYRWDEEAESSPLPAGSYVAVLRRKTVAERGGRIQEESPRETDTLGP